MYTVNQEDEALVKIVAMENIKMFDTSKNVPEQNINYDLMRAFPIKRTGKNGQEVKIKSQKLTGSGTPSVSVTNNSNSNTLVAVSASKNIKIFKMTFDVLIDRDEQEDGSIDASSAVKTTTKLLKSINLSLLLKGKAVDERTKKQIQLIDYSLLNVASKVKADKTLNNSTSLETNAFYSNEYDVVSSTGYAPDTLLISRKAFRYIVNSKADLDMDKFLNYNKVTLGLNIFPTEYLDDCGEFGACSFLYKNSEELIQLIYGKEAFVRSDAKNNYNIIPTVGESIGGFNNVPSVLKAIRCQTNLLG